jgi:uncharacterized protein (UPF0332 family)
MFYAVLALLAVEKKETSKHKGAVALFDNARSFISAVKARLADFLQDRG